MGSEIIKLAERMQQIKPSPTLAVNAKARLADTNADVSDEAMSACPVGALLRKHVGYAVPIGKRLYDQQPIGSEIEAKRAAKSG